MKKVLYLVIVLAAALLILGGIKAGMKLEKVTLRFSDWHLTEDVWRRSLNEALQEFKAQNPNIDVILEPVDYADKDYRYFTESEAGIAPDIFHIHSNYFQAYFAKGYARDLGPFINSSGGDKFLSAWYDLPINACKYNGKLMAMPGDFMSMVLYYNRTLFEEAGLDPQKPPETWDEFLDISKILTMDKDGDGVIDQWAFTATGARDPGFEVCFSPFIWSFGGDYLTEDMKHSALNRSETIAGFKFFVELITKYKVTAPGAVKNTPQGARVQLAGEEAAMKVGSGWTVPIIDDLNPDMIASHVLVAAPIPHADKAATSAWLSAWVMSADTRHPKEAWKLMEFITGKEMELKWFKDNGVLSSRRDVTGMAPEVLQDKCAGVIASQLQNARLVPQIKEWPEISDVVAAAVQEAINETKTPEQAILDAHLKVEEILNN